MIQAFGLTSDHRKDLPPAVDDVSFEAPEGRVTALLGTAGAGKTTTLRLMLELQQGRGITYFRGRALHRIAHPSREVGVLLGDVPGHPSRTVRGHLRLLCAAAGVPARRADEVLEVVGLVSLRDERLGTLSRGMDRRLGLACVLLADPHTLVLDNPAEGLSTREGRWLHGMLRAHAAHGGTVLFTTADSKEAARVADRVVTLEHGKVVADQETKDFARTRLRPRVAVRSPHAARLAALLAKEARAARRSLEVVREEGNRLSVYGSTCADVGDAAFRHGILIHQLADEVGDMDPGAGTTPSGAGRASDALTARASASVADARQAPADARQAPTDPRRAPTDVRQAPTDVRQAPTDVRQAPADARRASADVRLEPFDSPVARRREPVAGRRFTDTPVSGTGMPRGAAPSESTIGTAAAAGRDRNVSSATDLERASVTGRPGTSSAAPHVEGAPAAASPQDAPDAPPPESAWGTAGPGVVPGSPRRVGSSAAAGTGGAVDRPRLENASVTSRTRAASGPPGSDGASADAHPEAASVTMRSDGAPVTSRADPAHTPTRANGTSVTARPARPSAAERHPDARATSRLPEPSAAARSPETPARAGALTGDTDAPAAATAQPSIPTPRPAEVTAFDASLPLPPPISVHPGRSPLRPLRYELRRAAGISTGFVTGAAVLVLSALTALVLGHVGHTPQARLLTAWPRQLPLPPAALGAGLLGALAFGDEFRHPALAADRGTVPRRLGLLVAKLLVAAGTALMLAFLTVGCDAEALYVVYGRELAQVPGDWLSMGASWIGLVIGCAWVGVLAAGLFRSTTAGLAAVIFVPVLGVPLVEKALGASAARASAGLPARLREVFLLRWPFGGDRYLAAAAQVIAQPTGAALTLSLAGLLCAYLLTALRSRVR
ncbi:ATP-binding cassette domain-containing protein [Streptomyces sp. NPDC046197]|uniref:ATP-binding cassette domain-containing protein n=1 Tax=Streptomyces sp. NPDC046197 TaxID=3154337 RepID=UPI003403B6BF